MKKYSLYKLGLLLIVLLLINVTSAKAGHVLPADDCAATFSGTWDAGSGTCRSAVPIGLCPSGKADWTPLYPGAHFIGTWSLPTCIPVSSGSNGELIMSTSTQDPGRSDLILSSPANIYIHYAPTTCFFGCNLSTVLYNSANQTLNNMSITIYSKARVLIDGDPILNSYRICFVTDFLETATIYKYSGSWVPTGTTLYDGVACAYGSGSTQFALGK